MIRSAKMLALVAGLFAGAFASGGTATAQTAATGQFGQRAGNSYVPSTNDPGCGGILCNPLPAINSSGPARNAAEVAPPPPCQGLLCGLTPYSMQRPYTAAEAAEIERQRAAAQAQVAAAPPAEAAAPVRHVHKRRRIARATVPTKSAAVKAAAVKAPPPTAAARTPAPASADDIQTLR